MATHKRSDRSIKKPASPRFAIAILAAGKGTRLKSRHPKVLQPVAGKPLLHYVIAAATQVLPPADVYVIVGHEAERVQDAFAGAGVQFVLQSEQLGTGHALMCARQPLSDYDQVLVLSGDVPLLRPETIQRVRDQHRQSGAAMTVVTAEMPDPAGYGRIVRKPKAGRPSEEIAAIVEQKDLTPAQEKIREFNTGIYAFATRPLFAHIDRLTRNNTHREFYLTDMAAILGKAGEKVVAMAAATASEVVGANTRAELAALDAQLRNAKAAELMAAGVSIFRPETCVIDAEVAVGADTIIEPFVQLLGATRVGEDCRIGSYSVLEDMEIGDSVVLRPGCILEKSRIRSGANIGPYSHLRPGCDLGEGVHMGNFVEAKKTTLGRGSKANHLTYLGDATIGEKVNVGAGTITCNYDGASKHATVIEDGAFIGSDTTLVAPVKVGRGAYVAAAACVTEDVPEDSLAIARARQVNKQGWARRKRQGATVKAGTR